MGGFLLYEALMIILGPAEILYICTKLCPWFCAKYVIVSERCFLLKLCMDIPMPLAKDAGNGDANGNNSQHLSTLKLRPTTFNQSFFDNLRIMEIWLFR